MSIEIRNISKTFGDFAALKNVSFKVEAGELVALLGPSGSGKTSLLRIIAEIEIPDENPRRDLDSQRGYHRDQFPRPQGRFRVSALCLVPPHDDFRERRLRFARASAPPTAVREESSKERVNELLKLVQLDWLGDRLPSQLSGGQRQRIALARALRGGAQCAAIGRALRFPRRQSAQRAAPVAQAFSR